MSNLISDIRIYPVQHDTLKANVSATIMEAFAVQLKVIKTSKGMMVQMPSRSYQKDGETKYQDLFFPVTKEAREELISKVLEAYNNAEASTTEKPKSGSYSGGKKNRSGVPF
jgi:stage V sporulation protein G